MKIEFSDEQIAFIEKAVEGKNILVDACIGSGKTTTIQEVCNRLSNKKILYLTYNKLLKLDAKSKIKNKNVLVQNYHGYAWAVLNGIKIRCGIGDLIRTFNNTAPKLSGNYDVLILDEYQDIDDDISKMLLHIKNEFPNIQIIAVGDMEQKIYDYTSLDVWKFIHDFLGDFELMTFTTCFRLNAEYASELGKTWNKPIIGINNNCTISVKNQDQVYRMIKDMSPKNILCLGKQNGNMVSLLNKLESENRQKFNKRTVYASIRGLDKGRVDPNSDVAIFTTYDSSKGMERDTCIVFDFEEEYWDIRKNMPDTKYEILRNIFLVAASRGKRNIIFCTGEKPLKFSVIAKPFNSKHEYRKFDISSMFDYKYKEDIDDAFEELDIKEIELEDKKEIEIKNTDGMIDLSPCIGIFTEACYFEKYDINKTIEFQLNIHKRLYDEKEYKNAMFDNLLTKIRYSTYLATKQKRYYNQSKKNFITNEEEMNIKKRLSTFLPPCCETQIHCEIKCKYKDENGEEDVMSLVGLTDEIYEGVVYELKFTMELSHEHFLQLASYLIALNIEVGRLWNIRHNKMFEVRIKDRKKFMDKVVKAITKGNVTEFIDA